MIELTTGIFNLLKKIMHGSSVGLAVAYTIGHIIIAILTVRIVTGSSWWDAGTVALIEPCINGVWFYVLHKLWLKYKGIE